MSSFPPMPTPPEEPSAPLEDRENGAGENIPAVGEDGPEPVVRRWRDARRPSEWRAMRSPSRIRLFWVLVATAIAFFQGTRWSLQLVLDGVNFGWSRAQSAFNWESAPFYQLPPVEYLVPAGVLMFLLSPLALDAVLRGWYTLLNLPVSRIEEQFPETAGLIATWRQKHRLLAPSLQILSTKLPIAVAYGSLPRTARVVVSAGLLERLTDAELATLYATMFGQVAALDFFWISGMTAFLQVPYLLYWQIAQLERIAVFKFVRAPLAVLSAVFYGVYRFWRLTVLWLSRQRVYYSDRYGAELTGNPNALCRALLKTAGGIGERVGQLGHTPPLLESLDLLFPIDPRHTLCLGSLPPRVRYESVLGWDCMNPYRQWLSLSLAHPLLGERLFLLGKCARFWGVNTELDLPERRPSLVNKAELWDKLANFHQALPLLPRSFLFAFAIGIVLRLLFWWVGWIGDRLQFQALSWIHGDRPLLTAWVGRLGILGAIWLFFLIGNRFPHIFACVVILETFLRLLAGRGGSWFQWLDARDPFFDAWTIIALSISVIIWLNSYFPDPKKGDIQEDPDIGELLSRTDAIPSRGPIVRLRGKLLGRKGTVNWLAQDLFLQTATGTIELKYVTSLGPIGNIFSWFPRPCQYIGREITVVGWFRRGSSPWIDIAVLTPERGVALKSGYQVWLTLIAIAAALWGTYQLLTI